MSEYCYIERGQLQPSSSQGEAGVAQASHAATFQNFLV